jgi:hypothetical protein
VRTRRKEEHSLRDIGSGAIAPHGSFGGEAFGLATIGGLRKLRVPGIR